MIEIIYRTDNDAAQDERFALAHRRFGWLFEEFKVPNHVFWIAGGALRAHFANEKVKDIDVFFPSRSAFKAVWKKIEDNSEVLVDNGTVRRILYLTQKTPIDLVKRPFSSLTATLEAFDFTVACAALSSCALYFHKDFFYDLAGRRLRINALPFPAATLVRLQRYAHRGYHACPETMRQLALAINGASREALEAENLYHAID